MILPYLVFFAAISLIMLSLTEFRDSILNLVKKKAIQYSSFNFSDYSQYDEILSRYFQYYTNLNKEGKVKFMARLVDFIRLKKFQGMEKLKVTNEMKVLISASAIQLTFGLDEFLLDFFTTIKIYPRYFYSKLLQAEIKGGASNKGVLMISWEDFLKGYKYPHDNYNLGLHEMAHVLKINVLKGKHFDEKFSFYLDEWLKIGKTEFARLQRKNKSLLREYGGTNRHEFFAVCIEHFFENPLSFKEELPDIYNHLCFLLNQDPLNNNSNYMLNVNFLESVNRNARLIPIPKTIKKNYKYHTWHWTYSVMLFGIFLGIITMMLFPSFTIIPIEDLVKIALIGAVLATLFQYRYLVINNNILKPMDFVLYAFFGIMPAVLCLFFLTNFLVSSGIVVEDHKIINIINRGEEIVFQLENDSYGKYPLIRTMKKSSIPDTIYEKGYTTLRIKFGNGIMGYKTHLNNQLF
ncbi:MAG: zinc-dependent peptidase [Bacteroidetes bacterium]|nr:zinc-dependent peptidase [Bacteroidota bacterium]HET6243182.1 zinc-dependent peptidase [Bacteroidia bacterium]